MKLTEKIRNQKLGEAVTIGLEEENIQDMLFIFDDDGYVTDSDIMAWLYNNDEDTWTDEQGDTMQETWANGVRVRVNDEWVKYKFKGDIKIYGSEFGSSGIHEISTVSLKQG
jgi:hypothetical protein